MARKQLTSQEQTALCQTTAKSVNNMIAKNKEAIIQSLPRGFDSFDRMQRNIINAISTNLKLAECTPASLFLSSVQAFSVGLEIGGVQGYAHLVPFWNSKKGCLEAKFMPDYKGLIDVARRSGKIKLVYAEKVCENDQFTYERGTEPKLVHNPEVFGERGETKGYYAVVVFSDGTKDFEAMSMEDVYKVAKTSSTYRDGRFSGPWNDHGDEMAKKTVLKRLLKRCPMSIDLQKAVDADHKVSMGNTEDDPIIDVPGIVVDEPDQTAQAQINQQAKENLKDRIAKKKEPIANEDEDQLDGLSDTEQEAEEPEEVSDENAEAEQAEPPKPKKISNKELQTALKEADVPLEVAKDYLMSKGELKEGEMITALKEKSKKYIVENADKFKQLVNDWLDDEI